MNGGGVIACLLAKIREDQINLCLYSKQAKRGIDKHPPDLAQTK